MKNKPVQVVTSVMLIALGLLPLTAAAGSRPAFFGLPGESPSAALGTAFTYQGRLETGDTPVSDDCKMAFRLYDDATAGSQVGAPLTHTVPISDGLFTVQLDFGPVFTTTARWLGIRVMCPGDAGFADLGRQELTAAPYAQYASSTGALHGNPLTTTAPLAGQVLEWDGVAWGPALDDDTTYLPGNQLELVGTTFNVLEGSSSGLDADLLDGHHGDYYQARVSGACAVGSTIRAVNANGTVVCQVDAPLNRANPPMTTTITTLDSGGIDGHYTSITIGSDGLGLISYYVGDTTNLGVAHCNDLACTSSTLSIVDSTSGTGGYSSITIGSDGLGLISYAGGGNTTLKVAHCDDINCTSATITTLDSATTLAHTSITVGADGLGLISYYHHGHLKVAHCDNVNCTSATITTLDTGAGVTGNYTSIATGADGLGLISYVDGTTYSMRVAHCSNITCTVATLSTLDDAVGLPTSVVIGSDGLGLIVYGTKVGGVDELRAAHCSDITCTSAITTTLDHTNTYYASSVTIGADGLGLISYDDWTNRELKVAHCDNINCTSATLVTVDSEGDVGRFGSITLGVDGLGLISYMGDVNTDLKVAHCSNTFCVPYFRRR